MALRYPRWAARATFAALVTVVGAVSATTLAGAAPAAPAPGAWKTIPGVRADFGAEANGVSRRIQPLWWIVATFAT